ncbi:hypothetical protein K443DRAFT_62537, partial [Laccaria amethystina LaAM-08-1]
RITPNWINRLHVVQLGFNSAILDRKSMLCCTATGDGKPATHQQLGNLVSSGNLPAGSHLVKPSEKQPIRVVITPTKGLADNIVHKLSRLKISAFSY